MDFENLPNPEASEPSRSSKKISTTEKIRKNPWIVSTIVLGIFALLLVFSGLPNALTGKVISEKEAESIFLNTLESQGADSENIEITDIQSENCLYSIYFSYEGEEYPIPYYLTKDGSLLGMMSALSEPESSEKEEISNIPKADKPVVELFVMSYCPYGTQAEKGILPVVELLGDKIDFKLRFVYYLMHGETEGKENLRQYCVQKIAPEKLIDYMNCFLEGDGVETNGYIKNGNDVDYCLNQAGIDKTKLQNCMDEADEEFSITANIEDESSWLSGYYPLFDVDKELNEQYDIGGSPTLVINGQLVQSARDSASYLDTICQSFTEGNIPEECGEELSLETPSPFFGWETTGTSTTAQC